MGCNRQSIRLGIRELSELTALKQQGERLAGGGRKSAFETIAGLDEAFLRVIERHTAGSPMDESIKWTHLTRQQIADRLAEEEAISISVTVVDQLLTKHKFRRRQAVKTKATGSNPHRNQQFEKIHCLVAAYQAAGAPVISMDTKKKEWIGLLYRAGQTYTQVPLEVYDHDWASLATGKAIPHGLYDLTHNIGYVQIGVSHDTHELAIDSLRYWWQNYGRQLYASSSSLLLLCDGGGSNSSRSYLFKDALQRLANELGIEIRIAHYPPYTSKYNPIEHRLFPHLTRVCRGVIFNSVETVKDMMATATTAKGLEVFTTVIEKVYETGKKATEELKANISIVFDEVLPHWNYTAFPQPTQVE